MHSKILKFITKKQLDKITAISFCFFSILLKTFLNNYFSNYISIEKETLSFWNDLIVFYYVFENFKFIISHESIIIL